MKGKLKELFEDWLWDDKWCDGSNVDFEFRSLNLSAQWGVLQDFYDSQGINIFLTVEHDFGYVITENRYGEIAEVKRWYDTREEAREAALKKAEKILNKSYEV